MPIRALTKTELQAKCTAAQIATRDEVALAALVNVGRVSTIKASQLDIKQYLHQSGIWVILKKTQTDTAKAAATQAAATVLVEFLNSGITTFDTALAYFNTQLTALVTDGVIAQANKDALVALGTVSDPVTAADVALTLSGA